VGIASEPNPDVSNITCLNEAESTNQIGTFRANSKKHVLVVDDDALIRAFLYDALSKLDCEVATASSGAEGFKQFSRNSFDLVITDGKMPGTDGWQLAALIKQESTNTPIIMVTGQNKDEVVDKMQGGDIDFLIFKPFKVNKLYEAVRASFEIKLDRIPSIPKFLNP
jgi:DNA-binding NtrC family response regulator